MSLAIRRVRASGGTPRRPARDGCACRRPAPCARLYFNEIGTARKRDRRRRSSQPDNRCESRCLPQTAANWRDRHPCCSTGWRSRQGAKTKTNDDIPALHQRDRCRGRKGTTTRAEQQFTDKWNLWCLWCLLPQRSKKHLPLTSTLLTLSSVRSLCVNTYHHIPMRPPMYSTKY